MESVRKYFEDVRNRRVNLGQEPISEEDWKTRFVNTYEDAVRTIDRWDPFYPWPGQMSGINYVLGLLSEKPPNVQKIKKVSDGYTQLLRWEGERYARVQGTCPPSRFSIVHKKLLEFLEATFEAQYPIVRDLELIVELPSEKFEEKVSKGELAIHYEVTFPREVADATRKAYEEALSPHELVVFATRYAPWKENLKGFRSHGEGKKAVEMAVSVLESAQAMNDPEKIKAKSEELMRVLEEI